MALLPAGLGSRGVLDDRFELLDHIGRGSFGDVWKARNLATGEVVALKIPRDQELGEEILRQEPDLMKSLDHPHIVRVFGCHVLASHFVIEMEYVEGQNLAEIIDGSQVGGSLTYRGVLEWARQILAGLAAIHAAKILHNDIKPQNVLVDRNGHAKLVDFGTSRRIDDLWVWTRRQGTEAYWAPEVAFENRRSFVSDIYSIGVMLYEMVTGELPYRSPFELLSGRSILRPRERNANVPPELEAIILRAMMRDPGERYSSSLAMLQDVEKLLVQLDIGEDSKIGARQGARSTSFTLDSSSPLYYLDQAQNFLAQGDITAAQDAAESAVARSGGHPNYLRHLAAIYRKQGYLNKAIETYERALAAYQKGDIVSDRQQHDLLEQLGELYIKNGDYPKAIRAYTQLLATTDKPVFIRFRLAVAVGLNAEYRRAIRLLEEVRRERPDAAVVYGKLGYAHELMGDFRQALSYYNQRVGFNIT